MNEQINLPTDLFEILFSYSTKGKVYSSPDFEYLFLVKNGIVFSIFDEHPVR